MTPTEAAAPGAALPITEFEKKIGHPPGLFVLFFAEMWERFSYYGMRALLVFYMTKGFLGFDDKLAYSVYGAYGGLVYMMPFVGGMVADRLLGARRTVVIGGVLMAAGHLLMGVENKFAFYSALALLICGNGFFKPNISTMVGQLYGEHNKAQRDGGFTIFYMGINLGAAAGALICGYVGQEYGWHLGFGLATGGMIIGIIIFTLGARLTQVAIAVGGAALAGGLVWKIWGEHWVIVAFNIPVAIVAVVAAGFSIRALNESALPADLGQAPAGANLGRNLRNVLLATAVVIPVAALLVFKSSLVGGTLLIFGGFAALFVIVVAVRSDRVDRDRLFALLIMYFFSTLFWAFFEQAGSSMNNFADRNVDRVLERSVVTSADVGKTLQVAPTQELVGLEVDGRIMTVTALDALKANKTETVSVVVTEKHVGMGLDGSEVAASEFQAANALFILLFGLPFAALWAFLGARKRDPSTPVKFALGLLQLGLGFVALWWASKHPSDRGVVGAGWLMLAYLLHTTGEICLSPVGLSMVTKLSPKQMVSTMMGGWFLATAFAEYLAGFIATFTGVSHGGGDDGAKGIPPPIETIHIYGDVFGQIAVAAIVASVVLLAISPLLLRLMHMEKPMTGEG